MFSLLHQLVVTIHPFLVPICFTVAWFLVISFSWNLFRVLRDTAMTAKRMHDIPCSKCQFFTNDYRLKCTVHPIIANTEQAIGCRDYCREELFWR